MADERRERLDRESQDSNSGDLDLCTEIHRLVELMARLREPHRGCPWDLQQTYKTIAPSTIEEAYEVVDAIEKEDFAHLKEELGDLLFQVVFYAQLGREQARFSLTDIIHTLVEKLLSRHPHVFPDGTLESRVDSNQKTANTDIKQRWEAIKQQERNDKGEFGTLAGIPNNLPALTRALKLQKRAARVGFDWPDAAGVLAKIEEEVAELKQAILSDNKHRDHIEAEMGDVLFAVINFSRHLKVDPESALRRTNLKFEQRFHYIEERLREQGMNVEAAGLQLMDALWDEAKAREKK